jgi:lysophospholipase L1-like esterase
MIIKLSIALFLLGFVLHLALSYFQMQKLIALGTGLADEAIAFSRVLEAGPQFLVIGDSSAVGVGASKSADSIAGRIGADYPQASITNLGVNGAKTAELLPRLESLELHYDFILIQIGGNDIVRRTDLSELESSIDAILEEALKHTDQLVLMTSGNVGTSKLLPYLTRWFFTQRTRDVREIFMNAAKKHDVEYVDLFREKSDDPYAQDPAKYYSADFFHPSSDGYEDWYQFVSAKLEEISL